ncbi:MAG: hypothetical protein ACJ0DI_11910 [bacterium]
MPRIAESTFSRSERSLSAWGECAFQGGRGEPESVFVWSSPTVWDGPPSPGGRCVFFG